MFKNRFYLTFCFCVSFGIIYAQKQTDVLIVGAGTGGTAAAIQAARMGVKVNLLSENPWLGGMLTAAGVSAIDGNHQLPSGIWGDFRDALYRHYGGPKAVATGWVSNTHFEPSVGDSILKSMAEFPHLKISYNTSNIKVTKNQNGWYVQWIENGLEKELNTTILVDATETGSLLPQVGASFSVGMDASSETGEAEAPIEGNTIVQDLTYTLILKDLGGAATSEELVTRHSSYAPELFECACRLPDAETPEGMVGANQMLQYARLPNNKYLINWPNCGNDFYLDWPNSSHEQQIDALKLAKQHSLNFVYYIQEVLDFKHLAIHNEFGTDDSFPWIPYHRESRRVHGMVKLSVNEMRSPFDYSLYRTGIAVGDYPIDHHHDKYPTAPEIDFIGIKIPSYNVPLGSLIPKEVSNFIVAEKNISVTNIANGATRLQPVVLGIGQAAGVLAALSVSQQKSPDEIGVRAVQKALLDYKAYLMPYVDVKPSHTFFKAIQKIGATGILKGFGLSYKWANQTWFYPQQYISQIDLVKGLQSYYPHLNDFEASGALVDLDFIGFILRQAAPYNSLEIESKFKRLLKEQSLMEAQIPLNRGTIAQILSTVLDPFSKEINHEGVLINLAE